MRRHSKAKPDIILDDSEAQIVIAADNGTSNISPEKRKEDASKPLYLKRV